MSTTDQQGTGWSPHEVTSEEYVDPGRVAALAALLDSGAPAPAEGEDLPPLWHWVALPAWPLSSQLGVDGHPHRGGLLPPLPQPRRMFAGGSLELHAPLRVGERVRRESIVESVDEKSGRSGDFVVVRVRHVLRGQADDVRIEERQDLVFRDGPSVVDSGADPQPASELEPTGPPLRATDDGWDVVTDPTLLMRFSAATANPHRIHYDWPYATRVEGYPGLVVHGPLSTLLLAEALRLGDSAAPRRLRHRNLAPLFCAQPARISLTAGTDSDTGSGTDSDSGSTEVALRDPDDRVLVTLTADTDLP
ncbi:FAS1-like dehydratase domain-containing protein [Nocardioides sp. Root151]|uniref:FAS1-like dehydratase domain-containing protein n=1 Tax=Nocardioides sp. Root151 TaxID=1736475 RepID=UPI0009E90521|nr:MaoC family dehydratase N-terminal domain-containing protein [Nocardioides sp. Root151]